MLRVFVALRVYKVLVRSIEDCLVGVCIWEETLFCFFFLNSRSKKPFSLSNSSYFSRIYRTSRTDTTTRRWYQNAIQDICLHKTELVVIFDIQCATKCLVLYTILDSFLWTSISILDGTPWLGFREPWGFFLVDNYYFSYNLIQVLFYFFGFLICTFLRRIKKCTVDTTSHLHTLRYTY